MESQKKWFSGRKENISTFRASLAVTSGCSGDLSIFNSSIGYCDLWIDRIAG
jgi:hypothetical protein